MIAVCWKTVAADGDERWAGVSDADRAALEIGLRLADATSDAVTIVSVGGAAGEPGLREALAIGAAAAIRVDAPAGLVSDAVAAAVLPVVAGAQWIVCGDVSTDRGSGAVPAYLAAELDMSQALGLLDVAVAPAGRVHATRRLDGGRREVLDVPPPAVLSVEGGVARLRRASLTAELTARRAPIEVLPGPSGPVEHADAVRPFRPRARAIAAPAGEALARVLQLTHAGTSGTTHELVTLDPPDAAARILAALTEWGYLLGS